MVKAALTPMQFANKVQELKQNGIVINGTSGVAMKDSIAIGYHYENGELYAAAIKHPFYEPTSMIEKKLATWIGGDVVVEPTPEDKLEIASAETQVPPAASRG